jgi:hypothetical protein
MTHIRFFRYRRAILTLAALTAFFTAAARADEFDELFPNKPYVLLAASPFDGDRFPTPPNQNAPWTPPTRNLPPGMSEVAEGLFRDGFPDPRGCEYREIQVASLGYSEFYGSRGTVLLEETVGWVLPRKSNGMTFAIGWDGLIHPVYLVGKPAFLEDHLKETFLGWRFDISSSKRYQRTAHDALAPYLLLRLGEVHLAKRLMPDQIPRPYVQGHALDPGENWRRGMFGRAVAEFRGGHDHSALLRFRQLLSRWRTIDAGIARRQHLVAYEESGARKAIEVFSHNRSDAEALLADLERRRRNGTPRLAFRRLDDYPNPDKRIAALIDDLEQVRESSIPLDDGGPSILKDDPVIEALVREGPAALPQLARCYVREKRLTRAPSWWFVLSSSSRMLPVTEAVEEVVTQILGKETWESIRIEPKPGQTLSRRDRSEVARRMLTVLNQ